MIFIQKGPNARMATKLIQSANLKLGPNTMMFNIPACPAVCGRICAGCYSYKAYRMYPKVLIAQERRLEASKRPDFAMIIQQELASLRKKPTYFRIHGSAGEFYNQTYINAWAEIAKTTPNVIFYAYTKRLQDFDFTTLQKLSNMVLIDSLHFGKVNFGKAEEVPSGAYICPAQKDVVICGIDCTWCMQKGYADTHGVFFIKH